MVFECLWCEEDVEVSGIIFGKLIPKVRRAAKTDEAMKRQLISLANNPEQAISNGWVTNVSAEEIRHTCILALWTLFKVKQDSVRAKETAQTTLAQQAV